MAPPVETLDLEEISSLTRINDCEIRIFHLYGIFYREEKAKNGSAYWWLQDPKCVDGLQLKLCGSIDQYPKPKPGDIVRIHRSSIDNQIRLPIVLHPKNVVVWPAFRSEPTPITIARSPTITEHDKKTRRQLEQYYCSTLHRIQDIDPQQLQPGQLISVAGRVDEIGKDNYNHFQLLLNDGSAKIILRVFDKSNPSDSHDHYKVAAELRVGDYVVASSVKLDKAGIKLLLSANTQWGRSLRPVEKTSMLGVTLDEAFYKLGQPPPTSEPEPEQLFSSQSSGFSQVSLRRSPRIRELTQRQLNGSELVTISPISSQSSTQQNQEPANEPPLPRYTLIKDIKFQREGGYEFYDIAGQVRGEPNEARQYKNWVFQLYDGSSHNYVSYFLDEVKEPIADCVSILVYSKQKENDTDKHIEVAKKLQEGDLVMIRNIKISCRSGKIKLEVNPNLKNGKSIDVIDKDSRFGKALLELVRHKDVEEVLYSTPASQFYDSSFEVNDLSI